MARKCFFFPVFVLFTSLAWSWGGTTHKLINKEAVKHLPPSMTLFVNNAQWLSDHSVDADNRKSSDPTEGTKHFIDIDFYPEFNAGTLSHDINVLIAEYGLSAVTSVGVLPWATIWSLDSLTHSLAHGDTGRSLQFAADLGHYVGDAHQPLHVTSNYDGVQTGNSGIHSRYETSMMGTYLSQITVTAKQIHIVPEPIDFAFDYITHGNGLVDSILNADTYAKGKAGSTSGSVYYAALWEKTGAMTQNQIEDATYDLACLWYTAAVNAGIVAAMAIPVSGRPDPRFELFQNYPNPFNPSTTISLGIGTASEVSVKVYNLLGEDVATLISGMRGAGTYRVQWQPHGLPSGVYVCRLNAGGYSYARKIVFVK